MFNLSFNGGLLVAINKNKGDILYYSYNKGETWREIIFPFIFKKIDKFSFLGDNNDSFILIIQGKVVIKF